MRKISLRLILILVLNNFNGWAQPIHPADYGLKEYVIGGGQLGAIRFYMDTVNNQNKAPLFIDINGSGGWPLCYYVKCSDSSFVLNTLRPDIISKTQNDYHYIILGKPGTAFCDSIRLQRKKQEVDPMELMEKFVPSEEYNKRLSMSWRVAATKKVIDWLSTHRYWNGKSIVAFGYSEGAQVAPSLAVSDKRITQIACFVGSGLNQFYDGIMNWRIKAARGEISHEAAQDSIDALMAVYKDIYAHKTETDKQYEGHSYQRWASFCSVAVFEQLRKLQIPIFVVAGTDDSNSPIYSLDYIALDFARLGKTNLRYETCVGCDHGLTARIPGKDPVYRFDEFFEHMLSWLDGHSGK